MPSGNIKVTKEEVIHDVLVMPSCTYLQEILAIQFQMQVGTRARSAYCSKSCYLIFISKTKYTYIGNVFLRRTHFKNNRFKIILLSEIEISKSHTKLRRTGVQNTSIAGRSFILYTQPLLLILYGVVVDCWVSWMLS